MMDETKKHLNASYFVTLLIFAALVFVLGQLKAAGLDNDFILAILATPAVTSIFFSITNLRRYKFALWQFAFFNLLSIFLTIFPK